MLVITITSALASEVSYYDFEENTGTTLIDQTGSNDGTIDGMTWSATYPSFNTSSNGASYSGSFDGIDDEVVIGSAYQIGTNDFSFSVWFNTNDNESSQIILGNDYSDGAQPRFFIRVLDEIQLFLVNEFNIGELN
jgi:hypothetical protein